MEKIKTSEMFLVGAIFASIFCLVAKALNIFVFDSLFYPVLIGFIVGAEVGFFCASPKLHINIHKKVFGVFPVITKITCMDKKIIKIISYAFLVLAGFFFGLKVIINFPINAIPEFDIVLINAIKLTTMLLSVILLMPVFFISNVLVNRLITIYEKNNWLNNILISFLLGLSVTVIVLSAVILFFVVVLKKSILLHFLLLVLPLQYCGLMLTFAILRLAAYSQLASVAMGGVFGAFCGYLMPGWGIWELELTIEMVAVSALAGGCVGVVAHMVGQWQIIKNSIVLLGVKDIEE